MTPPPDTGTGSDPGPAGAPDAAPAARSAGGIGLGIKLFVTLASLAIVVIAVAVWVAAGSDDERESQTIEIVVPAGTQDRLDAGEEVTVMPTRLEFRVGDRILIRNDDDVRQSVGPYEVAAGEEMLLQYGAPGVYEGYCPISEGERYEIVVEP